jgi:hypothetical protein
MTTPNNPSSDTKGSADGIGALFAPNEIHQLLLSVTGAFGHLQLMIDEILAPAFFRKRTPHAAKFLLDRVVKRIRDEDRPKLVTVIAAELACDVELDDFAKVYNEVKDLRDTTSHAARIQPDGPDRLLITDTYLADKLNNATIERADLNAALRKCRWLETQILYIIVTTGLGKNFQIAGLPIEVVKPPRRYSDWNGIGMMQPGDYRRSFPRGENAPND